MKIALLQYPIVWADIKANLSLTLKRLAALEGQADVALLPEMFSTGFCTDRPELAEPVTGHTISTLQGAADRYGIAIASSFICYENGKLFNRGFFLRPNDNPIWIDKRHLYAHGGEDTFFAPADKRVIIEYQGVKLMMLVCYDLRFPVWTRNKSGYDYDIILVCANWPEIRIHYWDVLVPARAVENQAYICAVNPIGDDPTGMHYNGHSIAYDTRLRPLAKFADNEEGTRIANFDIDILHHFREALPLWKDVDKFNIEDISL